MAFGEARDYAKGLREVMLLADRVNAYVDQNKPWELAKQEGQDERLHEVCTVCVEAFRVLTIYLKPVLPALAGQVEAFLNVAPMTFADVDAPLPAGHVINGYQHLLQRVDPKQLTELFPKLESVPAAPEKTPKKPKPTATTPAAQALGAADADLPSEQEAVHTPGVEGSTPSM